MFLESRESKQPNKCIGLSNASGFTYERINPVKITIASFQAIDYNNRSPTLWQSLNALRGGDPAAGSPTATLLRLLPNQNLMLWGS